MKKVTLLSAATSLFIFGACSDSQFEGFKKAENGLHYKFYNQADEGRKVQEGDGVTFSYIISKHSNDSVIVNSNNVSADGSGYVQFAMNKSSFNGSFEDGMMMMTKGDSAAFIISADSFFLKTNQSNELPPGFKPGEFLKGVFKIKEIRTKAEMEANQKKQMEEQEAMMKENQAKEKPAIEKYLADNNITVKPTASGLYYIEDKKGTGPSPKETDIVKMHYTGRLLDGTKFDSSVDRGQPLEYPLNQMIAGWIEGVQLMKKGGKARFVVPSNLGYGPQGNQGIPPFSPLTFEVELIDFTSAPAQSAQPGQPGH